MKKLFAFAIIGGMLLATSCTRKQCPAYGVNQPTGGQSAVYKA